MSSQSRRVDLEDYAVMATLAQVAGMLQGIALALDEGCFEQEPVDYGFLAHTLRKGSAKLDSLYAKGVQMAVQTRRAEHAFIDGNDLQLGKGKGWPCDGRATE